MKEQIFSLAEEFSQNSHGSSAYDSDNVFVMGRVADHYVPLSYLVKKISDKITIQYLHELDFIYSSADFLDDEQFQEWFKKQFGKKLTTKQSHQIGILHLPNETLIRSTIDQVSQCYKLLKTEHVINNGKNLPVQLAEWYSKIIFGLRQVKSTSQRGFDFFNSDHKRVEVMVDWNDRSSPKGAKLKKSLVELSDYCIVMYITTNFLVRDIVYLDSSFIMRKFSDKGHTIFLKDNSIGEYFFSVSAKHHDKLVSRSAILRFAAPAFKAKLESLFNLSPL